MLEIKETLSHQKLRQPNQLKSHCFDLVQILF